MCLYPQILPNPNYGYKGKYAFMKDCVSRYIKVPCGTCGECLAVKQMSLVQRCSLESLSGWPFFSTLTYNEESMPHIATSKGRSLRYADITDVQDMIKRIRKDNLFGRPFRYLAVSELGSTRARPHFHILWFVQKYPQDTIYTPLNLEKKLFEVVLSQWKRNVGSRRSPVYQNLCTYVCRIVSGKLKSTYDLHYVSPSTLDGTTLDVPFYVSKYMMKPSEHVKRLQQALRLNYSDEEYSKLWNIVRPRYFSSLNFGFGLYDYQAKKVSFSERLTLLESTESFKIVRESIDRSLRSSDRPKFFNPETGSSMPLSRYWKSFGNLYTPQDAIRFHYLNPQWREDNVSMDDRSIDDKLFSEYTYRRRVSQIESNQDNQNLLFD